MPVQTRPVPVAHSSRELTGNVHRTYIQHLFDYFFSHMIPHTLVQQLEFSLYNRKLTILKFCFSVKTEFKEFNLKSLVRHSSDLAAQAKLINESVEIDAQVISKIFFSYSCYDIQLIA
jgi:hypothetical protein